MPVSTTSTGTQVVSSAIKPQFVTTNTQFIPTLAPKLAMAPIVASSTITPASVVTTTTSSSKLVPATLDQQQSQQQQQPHFVIQAPRTPAGSSATIVPVSVGGPGMGKHTFAYLGTIIKPGMGVGKPGESPQLVLPTAGLVPATNQKLLLAPVPVLPQLAPAPPPIGNTTISSSSQQPKVTSLLVPMTIPATVGGGKSGMINLKISNGQIHTEGKGSVTVLREAKPLTGNVGQLPPLQPISKYSNTKTTSIKANGLLLPDSTTLTPLKDASTSMSATPKKLATDDESSIRRNSAINNSNANNNKSSSGNTNNTSSSSDDKRKLNQDLNRCLKETVDAIFSPNSPTLVKDNGDKVNSTDDEVTLIKVNPLKEESAVKEKMKKELPEDDVKIEIIKQDIKAEQTDTNAEDFDPMKVLEWKDGIGTLPGSNLKFRLNEFGMMEVVDDEDYEKLLSSKKTDGGVKDEPTAPVSIPEVESDASGKKNDDEGTDNQSVSKNVLTAKPTGTSDDIYCCEGCGCYGLASEFVSSRFCSHTCASAFASKKAAQSKKERDLLQLRLRRRKKRLLHLMQQQLQNTQQQQGDGGKIRTSATLSASLQSTSTVTSSSVLVPASSKTPTLSEEENMSNDGTQDASKPRLPWQTGKSGFSWTKYLEHCKAKAAPIKLFKDPFPYSKNGFKVGMKMEGIDPEHPSYYCVLTVADVQGYRIRLHFDGYSDNYDFWVNADSMDIFPAGWCEKNNHRLHPPRGYTPATFNWSSYLKQCRAQAAPRNLFANKTGSSICPNGFRLGMKLEAVDRKNSSLVCVATVAELMDNRILVHFDSWDDIYDYWADPMSPYIHPVGWCEEHGHTLTPPNNYSKGGSNRAFSWETYLKETKSVAAPARAFKQRPLSGFRRGMKLECVDKRVPMLIRVATVDDVGEHQIRIKFDGWPDQYSYWIDDDSPDINPMGWCQKTGHPLEPPLTPEEMVETPECPTPGCRGLGHVKGAKYVSHHTTISCPYSPQNLNKDGLIPDRILSKTDQGESKEETISKERSKPAEGKNPVGRPPKWRRIELAEDPKAVSQDPDWKLYDEDSSERRRKKRRHLSQEENVVTAIAKPPITTTTTATTTITTTAATTTITTTATPILSSVDMNPLHQEMRQSVMNPGYEVKPDHLSPHVWAKHSRYLNQYVQAVKSGNPSMWSVDQVAQFVWSIPDCCHVAHNFKEQQIDGEALLMMAQNDLVQHMEMKLGPAIKLYNSIVLLRQRIRRS
ncbi:lethal(3)malignant brain tumor-like protein 3 isoform X2 [Zootermopsis nevadensis]|uniref:lethal(3)malignant brain tumor-like protein 3 isoform X2 n=1 Tax=Zootermopsis nevadensis TaxID=136037 RepID=UPI000B8E54D1|nr:lethal(3)malignant brain tumor-like protein 3 isoform X2 [Zootermopsis nevadensis]